MAAYLKRRSLFKYLYSIISAAIGFSPDISTLKGKRSRAFSLRDFALLYIHSKRAAPEGDPVSGERGMRVRCGGTHDRLRPYCSHT